MDLDTLKQVFVQLAEARKMADHYLQDGLVYAMEIVQEMIKVAETGGD